MAKCYGIQLTIDIIPYGDTSIKTRKGKRRTLLANSLLATPFNWDETQVLALVNFSSFIETRGAPPKELGGSVCTCKYFCVLKDPIKFQVLVWRKVKQHSQMHLFFQGKFGCSCDSLWFIFVMVYESSVLEPCFLELFWFCSADKHF